MLRKGGHLHIKEDSRLLKIPTPDAKTNNVLLPLYSEDHPSHKALAFRMWSLTLPFNLADQ